MNVRESIAARIKMFCVPCDLEEKNCTQPLSLFASLRIRDSFKQSERERAREREREVFD